MSTKRFSTTVPANKLPKGPNGRNLCRWCKTEVPKGRRTFCGKESCLHEFNIRRSSSYVRHYVYQRDKGICAICKLNTDKLEKLIRRVTNRAQGIPYIPPKIRRERKKNPFNTYLHLEYDKAAKYPTKQMIARGISLIERLSAKYGWVIVYDATSTFSKKWTYKVWVSLWQADHIIPVAEGGGECGLENYRTLCTPCHNQVTRELRARLRKKKKETQK